MQRLHRIFLVLLLSASAAWAAPAKLLTQRAATRYMEKVVQHERLFYKPGIGYDGASGLTFDGHAVDFHTGELRGGPRNWSASSKESLHLILLTKAIAGEHLAEVVTTPDPKQPKLARAAAIDLLTKKIGSYEKFDREYPGYGGFLPWYKIEGDKVSPTPEWTGAVPGLDNGQLAWSMYLTANALRDAGEPQLAARYQAHLDKMRANVVRIFYDPARKKMRAEAKIDGGNHVAPDKNTYSNNQPSSDYMLDDAYEGLLLCHFADLMGDWKGHEGDKEAIFASPRRVPATMHAGEKALTTARGHWLSAHEDWGYLVLPFRDVPVAKQLYAQSQRGRTRWSEEHGWSGLLASTHDPVTGNETPGYHSALGVTPLGKLPTTGKIVFAPYAAFPLALVDKPLFATWLSSMTKQKGMFGKYGIGESYAEDGSHAPLLTWDGKALPLVAWMGGIAPDIARLLKRDGLYDQFKVRVEHDFSTFDNIKIKGTQLPMGLPPN